jgi:NAD(P)-dependent dehydrogenase (short-subunit alcohol dehydrogenase family)
MYEELSGKTVLITGAGRLQGIGASIARRLAAEGCNVMLTDVGERSGPQTSEDVLTPSDSLNQIAREICEAGGVAAAMTCNVLVEDDVERACRLTKKKFGSLDILVNNAGIGYLMQPLTKISSENWDAVLGVNLKGAFLATKHASLIMISQGSGGRIINIASQAAKSGFPHAAAYVSSKHGLIGLTRVSAIELGEHEITANAICPNQITTGLGEWQNDYFSKKFGQSLEEYMTNMRSRIPLGRPGLTEDISNTCAFLCSDQARYITGESMNVSGGEEMH